MQKNAEETSFSLSLFPAKLETRGPDTEFELNRSSQTTDEQLLRVREKSRIFYSNKKKIRKTNDRITDIVENLQQKLSPTSNRLKTLKKNQHLTLVGSEKQNISRFINARGFSESQGPVTVFNSKPNSRKL